MGDTVTITADLLREHNACSGGVERFARAFPDGLDYDPESHECAARIAASEVAGDLWWTIDEGIVPAQRLTACDRGTATAGYRGTAQAGDHGTAQAGGYGSAQAGDFGTATAGHHGTARAGDCGSAQAGDFGTATAGVGGAATAGDRGTLAIRWWDGERYRLAVAYVGEDGIEPDTPYRLERVADGVRWVEVRGV